MYSKKLLITILTIALIGASVLVLGCTNPTATPTATPASTGPTDSQTPALSGKILITGSTSVQPHMDNLTTAFRAKYPNVDVQVSGGGSGTGIKNVGDGTSDMGMSSRDLTAAEESSGLKPYIIAYDGIAVIVSKDSSVSDLTKDQIRDIFAGNVTNWKDVGGSDAKITVFQREAESGTRTAFNELVMGKTNVTKDALQSQGTLTMIQSVKNNRNAIGYCSYSDLSPEVKALKVGGVAPSVSTIQDKSYVIQRPFLFVTRGEPTNPITVAFIDFVLSPEGQNILAADNLVKVS